MKYDSRCRHTVQGAETSGGVWQVTGAVNVQVGGASCPERRWVVDATQRARTMNN